MAGRSRVIGWGVEKEVFFEQLYRRDLSMGKLRGGDLDELCPNQSFVVLVWGVLRYEG